MKPVTEIAVTFNVPISIDDLAEDMTFSLAALRDMLTLIDSGEHIGEEGGSAGWSYAVVEYVGYLMAMAEAIRRAVHEDRDGVSDEE
jgi:hypothetical protein